MLQVLIALLILINSVATVIAAKVAAVDLTRIYDEYSLIQEANQVIDEAESRVKRLLATADKELKELEASGTQAAIQAKQEEIQNIVDEEIEKLHDQKELYNLQINRNIDKALKSLAERNSYELILNKIQTAGTVEDATGKFLIELQEIHNSASSETINTTGK